MNLVFFFLSLVSALALAFVIDIFLMREHRPWLGYFLGLIPIYLFAQVNILLVPPCPEPSQLCEGPTTAAFITVGAAIALVVVYSFLALLLTQLFYLVLDDEVATIRAPLHKAVILIEVALLAIVVIVIAKLAVVDNLGLFGVAMYLAVGALFLVSAIIERPYEFIAITITFVLSIAAFIWFRKTRARSTRASRP